MNTESRSSTVSMKGGGYYSLNTLGAKDVIDNTRELALAALGDVDVDAGPGAFQIADFGAADGGTSIDLVRSLIEAVRGRSPGREILVTYTDLPRNDYSALFRMLAGERDDVHSYLADHDGVYVTAAGTSFYLPILPSGCLDFGFSATAMHWLSRLPGRITDHVHAVGARGDELEVYRAQALADWETILLQRARELRSGARLVMSNFCIDEQGRYLGGTDGVNMFDTFNQLWREMAGAGDITQAEYQRTAFPQFYKNVDEYCAPLRDTSSPVYRAGLRLVSAETRIVECPYARRFREEGDADAFAVAYVPTLRSWSETVFMNGLDASVRSDEERRMLVESFFQRYVDCVRQAPEGHAMDYVHIYMVAEKA
jgi:hypothetical protein